MKKILAITLMLAMAAPFGGASVALADSSTDPLCGPGAPEGYKRPGGYCEQIDSKSSLTEKKDCVIPVADATIAFGDRILVAEYCYEHYVKQVTEL